jgi:protein ImuB
MRPRDAGDGGDLVIRTAAPMRDLEHLCRLLAENLAQVQLLAPAGELELEALDVHALEAHSATFLPEAIENGVSLTLVLERIAARLGPARVLRPVLIEDHRPEWMQHWQAALAHLPKKRARQSRFPQPTFILPEPLRLAMKSERPLYQGPLQMLVGPHRVEGGWWHRVEEHGTPQNRNVVRDYWVALSEHGGALLVFQQRLADDQTAWYLQGSYA